VPPSEIEIILSRIDRMDEERKHDYERLYDKLDKLTHHGCARASQHKADSDDHEQRLRAIERHVNREAGQVALIGGGVGLGGGLLVALGQLLLKKVL